jgi:S1-C subfamily serine protease
MSRYEPYDPPYREPVRPARWRLWVLASCLVLVLAGAGFLVWRFLERPAAGGAEAAHSPTVVARGSLQQEQQRAEAVYKKVAPSVVHVTRLAAVRDRFTLNLEQVPAGTGSGFVWDDQGHIVTNNHVIENVGFGISVTLPDHSTWPARVVDAFPDKDLAVLRIDAPKASLRPIAVGSSHDLRVGQSAYVIGNPFGLDQSFASGVISALGRHMQTENKKTIQNVIQTSAPINPGNSGGPLLDGSGRLIGVTTAILSPSGAWAGVGFAIPVDEVNEVVTQAIRNPRPEHAALGVTLAAPAEQQQLGAAGPLILDVLPGSAAEKAGLRPTRRSDDGDVVLGDVIMAVGGQNVQGMEDVRRALAGHKVGETVPVTVLRDDRRLTVKVTLQAGR